MSAELCPDLLGSQAAEPLPVSVTVNSGDVRRGARVRLSTAFAVQRQDERQREALALVAELSRLVVFYPGRSM